MLTEKKDNYNNKNQTKSIKKLNWKFWIKDESLRNWILNWCYYYCCGKCNNILLQNHYGKKVKKTFLFTYFGELRKYL